ncbi:unnamed protein product [Pieris brassicae]|uniref:Nose resistant-to-fluoxetine protein N-terminal domain-containing protein n=1 Tax=Pieris brassicae TaxID=7116 RepID=A0A9P0TB46_PIEBR|nr:unnamed protein product [Pieris brassicae]
MDRYEDCTLKLNGTYCLVQFVLVSDTQSGLLDMINEYSSNKNTRYNHSLLRHGICVPEQCSYANKKDQVSSLEACLNDTYWQKYKLKTKVLQPLQCNTDVKEPIVFAAGNVVVLVIIIVIIIMNLVGTLYHSCLMNSRGNRFLLCFSIKQNISKLRTSYTNLDDDEQQIKCFHGLRLTPSYALILVFTITWLGHLGSGTFWQVAIMSEVEWCRESWLYYLFYINNYVNSNRCMYHSWYMASNVQVMILGYFVCVLARGRSAKIWTMAILIAVGTIIPAAHTFYQDLDAVLFVSPE